MNTATREGYHRGLEYVIYNYGRRKSAASVRNALYWIERFGIDALRVDAVASMSTRDWPQRGRCPIGTAARENLEAVNFCAIPTIVLGERTPGAVTMAESLHHFAGVSTTVFDGRS